MIELRTLGTIELRDSATGRELRSLLAQEKRSALLFYLALAAGRGYHRRDELMALFWPEMPEKRARAALRQALYVLRREMGDALDTRAGGDVRLDPARFRCDAGIFDDLLAADQLERALELYRGDLLPGFHVAGCPEFEAWLEGERTRLREAATRAAWTLSQSRAAAGAAIDAVHWARRATEWAPYDESGIRRLLELLERLGDRAGAVREYAAFRGRLQRDLELEPAPETAALGERLAAGAAAQSAETMGSGLEAYAVELESRVERVEPRSRPTLREHRPAMVGVLAALLMGALALVWASSRGPSEPTSDTKRVAVLPFTARTADELAYLGTGVADLLDTNIDGVGGYRTVDRYALSGVATSADHAAEDPLRARAVAERFGATFYVLGSVVAAGGRLRVRAALYSAGSPEPLASAVADGEVDDLFTVVDRLTVGLFGERGVPPAERIERLAELTTRSLPALRAYLDGEALSRSGDFYAVPGEDRFGRAIEAYRRAVAADSTFALAWYRLARAAGWAFDRETERQAMTQALRYADRLPERYRLLVRGAKLEVDGRAAEAERLFRSVLAVYPDDPEAWYGLAETLNHHAPVQGRSIAESRAPFERVLAIDPGHRHSLNHLLQIAVLEGDRQARDSLLRRVYGTNQPLPRRAGAVLTWGDSAARAAVWAELLDSPPLVLDGAFFVLLADRRNVAAAEHVNRALAGRDTLSPEWQGVAVLHRAYLRLAAGRVQEAKAAFETAAAVYPGVSLAAQGQTAALPFLAPSAAELRALRDRLRRWDGTQGPLPPMPLFRGSDPAVPTREYLLGIANARLGDAEAAVRHASELERWPGEPPVRALARDLAREVRAMVDWQRARPAQALRTLSQAEMWSPHGAAPHLLYKRANGRFLRAMLLERAGRPEEALRWYASLAQGIEHGLEMIYAAPAHFARGRILQELGRVDEAVEQYRAFLGLWSDPDPELRPLVREAERRVAALSHPIGSGRQR